MCMSFTDLTLKRQEEIAVEAHRLAAENVNDRWWGSRALGFDDYLKERYSGMPEQDIREHVTALRNEHSGDTQWLVLADLAEAALPVAA